MRTPSLALVIAPFFAAVSLFSACVGSDTPAVDTKVDSSVPPVDGGPGADGGADAPLTVADAAPKTCRPGDPFGEPVAVIENLTGTYDLRGARRIPGIGMVYAQITDPYTSKLRIRRENAAVGDDPIVAYGDPVNGADIRSKNGVLQIAFTTSTYPIGDRLRRPERILNLGTLTASADGFAITDPRMVDVPVLDPADPVFADTGLYISYLKNSSIPGNADYRTIRFMPNVGVEGGIPQQQFDLFKDQVSRTAPLYVAGAPLYFSALNSDLDATKLVAYSPDADPKETPSTIANTAKWPAGVSWISPDQCEILLSLPSSRIPDHTGIYSAKRTPR